MNVFVSLSSLQLLFFSENVNLPHPFMLLHAVLWIFRNERQWRDLSFCLSMLSYSDKGLRKLQENFSCFSDKLVDDAVYGYFVTIISKSRTGFTKPEAKVFKVKGVRFCFVCIGGCGWVIVMSYSVIHFLCILDVFKKYNSDSSF